MTGEEIKALLAELDVTPRQLGERIGVDAATVIAWQREERFPTKKYVEAMRAVRETMLRGAAGEAASNERPAEGMEALADPAVWGLIRKVLAYPELRREVEKVAERYADPAGKKGRTRGSGRG